jgi:hypothetical protein
MSIFVEYAKTIAKEWIRSKHPTWPVDALESPASQGKKQPLEIEKQVETRVETRASRVEVEAKPSIGSNRQVTASSALNVMTVERLETDFKAMVPLHSTLHLHTSSAEVRAGREDGVPDTMSLLLHLQLSRSEAPLPNVSTDLPDQQATTGPRMVCNEARIWLRVWVDGAPRL